MRTAILLAFVAVLGVCHVRGQSAQCLEATKAALKYRDFALQKSDPWHDADRLVKDGIKFLDFNIQSDREIQDFVCGVIDTDEKTIAYISSNHYKYGEPRKLAFLYSSIVGLLQGHLVPSEFDRFAKQLHFYDVTGFPDFPLKIDATQLSKVISETDDSTLSDIFRRFADYESGFKREELLAALTSADSLEDFVKDSFPFEEYYHYFDDRIEEDVQMIRNDSEWVREDYQRAKEELVQTERIHRVFKKTGFFGVTRGGPELYSCDFIADTAVEALEYVMELFGRPMVQMAMTRYMGLNFTVDDTAAVREWVCAVSSSKTQEDFMKFVPAEWKVYMDDLTIYQQMAFSSQYLLNSGYFVGPGMEEIRIVKLAEKLNFPKVSKDQAKHFVAVLKSKFYYASFDEDSMVEVLMDAKSIDDAVEVALGNTWILSTVQSEMQMFGCKSRMQKLGCKTDLAVKLATRVYELVMSAEELGLFMLPPN